MVHLRCRSTPAAERFAGLFYQNRSANRHIVNMLLRRRRNILCVFLAVLPKVSHIVKQVKDQIRQT